MNNPKVSVIVPVYNVGKYINRCVDSILSQTFTDFECILVDDCTPDNSGKICDEYALKDHRIKVIHKPVNEGLPQARKTGFEHSNGDYILNVDSDDCIEKDMLEKMYTKAIAENLDFIYCDYFFHNEDKNIQRINPLMFKDNIVDNLKVFIFDLKAKSYVWNKMIKRDVYKNIKFLTFASLEDKYITTQIVFYSKNINYLNEPLYHYYFNSSSISNSMKRRIKSHNETNSNMENIIIFLKENYKGNIDDFNPELNNLLKMIKENNPVLPNIIIKSILLKLIPSKLKNYLKRTLKKN